MKHRKAIKIVAIEAATLVGFLLLVWFHIVLFEARETDPLFWFLMLAVLCEISMLRLWLRWRVQSKNRE